jgi:ParE toxin of type II toxin-antitoxin system, parDE
MQINYTKEASASLISLINFIESKNTKNAGLRWLSRYEAFLQKTLFKPTQIKRCHNLTFNKLDLRCIYFNDWLIAFSIHKDFVLIEALLHKSRISD